jgi:hypothetical protein
VRETGHLLTLALYSLSLSVRPLSLDVCVLTIPAFVCVCVSYSLCVRCLFLSLCTPMPMLAPTCSLSLSPSLGWAVQEDEARLDELFKDDKEHDFDGTTHERTGTAPCCVHVCMCVSMFMCVYACMCMRMCDARAHWYTVQDARATVCVSVYVCVSMFMCVYACMCIYVCDARAHWYSTLLCACVYVCVSMFMCATHERTGTLSRMRAPRCVYVCMCVYAPRNDFYGWTAVCLPCTWSLLLTQAHTTSLTSYSLLLTLAVCDWARWQP